MPDFEPLRLRRRRLWRIGLALATGALLSLFVLLLLPEEKPLTDNSISSLPPKEKLEGALPEVPEEPPLKSATQASSSPVVPAAEELSGSEAVPSKAQPVEPQEKDSLKRLDDVFDRGETLSSALLRHGVSYEQVHAIVRAARPLFNLNRVLRGNAYRLGLDPQGVRLFEYDIDDEQFLRVERRGESDFEARLVQFPSERRLEKVHGIIKESLFDAVIEAGEGPILASLLADIFAWDIDFHKDFRKGDSFKAIVEKRYREGEFIGYQRVIAAEFRVGGRTSAAIFFKDPDGHSDYYSPDGNSMKKRFLRSPLRFRRISSRFSRRRYHPILKRHIPHFGIDYVAPAGTPVRAVGDGVVIFAGRNNGAGKMVKLRHHSRYTSIYMHLSRFGRGIRRGVRVAQGQVIGYVGSTGLATGPHLDFRLERKGRLINPLKARLPAGAPVKKKYRHLFRKQAERMMELLAREKSVLAMEGEGEGS